MDISKAIALMFTVKNPDTGVLCNATGTPTVSSYKNGVSETLVFIVTNLSEGIYKATSDFTGEWSVGDIATFIVTATVNGVAYSTIIEQASLTSDLKAILEADIKVITVNGHYEKVWYEKGTTNVLMTKKLRLLNGELATNSKAPIGQFTMG